MTAGSRSSLPTVIVPVFNALAGLDACLAALERNLPTGAAVLLADDASSDPQVEPLARTWCQRSRLAARYIRNPERLGLAANCDAALADVGDADVVLLGSDAVVSSGWLQQLARCAEREPGSASIMPWSNDAELCSFPQPGEANAPPAFPEAIAEAAASIDWNVCPEVPTAAGPCVYLRRDAIAQMGGLDAASFSGARAVDDFCRRAVANGWRNVLCPSAFVSRVAVDAASSGAGEELSRLLARWPDYQEQVAKHILADPLRPLRERLLARIDELARGGPQRDLFN
jgi:GT2 family glycosyltransferase